MKKFIVIFSILMISNFQAQGWKTEDQYIQKFAKYAVEEMEKYNIPASITLAQGLLETGGGQSILAQQGNNHFGIKCKEDWTGKTMKYTDDAPNECFRVYENPKDSYEDHSKFLANRPYYKGLFQLDPKDYKAWAHGLKKAGYATNSRYAYILIDKIEKYKLFEFDFIKKEQVTEKLLAIYPDLSKDKDFLAKNLSIPKATKEDAPKVVIDAPEPVKLTKNEVLLSILMKAHPNEALKYIVIPIEPDYDDASEVNLEDISKKYEVSVSKLIKWNELTSNNLKEGQILFLEKKNSSGTVDTYTAEKGDNMYTIAQKFAVKLDKLYDKNRMNYGDKVKEGQIIYLKNRKPRS
ncbi:glucosaminidase domain-containing protein [Cloacibacterium sp.]|uniref:glucosaminidase domain-containing protein n=1 Tax=Cloacibacterium sp. TaxID=1913682 RepID=UPI0039E38523